MHECVQWREKYKEIIAGPLLSGRERTMSDLTFTGHYGNSNEIYVCSLIGSSQSPYKLVTLHDTEWLRTQNLKSGHALNLGHLDSKIQALSTILHVTHVSIEPLK